MEESNVEKLINKLNPFIFLVERFKAGASVEELKKVADMSYKEIENIRELFLKVELNCCGD